MLSTTFRGARRPATSRRQPPSSEPEGGVTLVELMVAMTVSLIILTSLAAFITVFSKAEASTVSSANAAADTRMALLQLQHDIQSAKSPIAVLASSSSYDDTLMLTSEPSGQVITWQYIPSNGELTRQVGSSGADVELTGVTNGDPASGGLPVFTYYDRCFNNLVDDAQSSGAGPATVADNVTVIKVTLAVKHVSSAPYGSTTAVNIMNVEPGLSPCG
jgi:type II secretory pathway component PulJ